MSSHDEERLNQEWQELLEELRVLLPGVQVLFAFLLAIPFTERFGEVAHADKTVYFVSFLSAAAAALLLIAPSAQHRLLWRRQAKEQQLQMATRLAVSGTVCMAVSVASAVFLITNLLYNHALPAAVTAGVVGLVGWLWYGWPLAQRRRAADRSPSAAETGLAITATERRGR